MITKRINWPLWNRLSGVYFPPSLKSLLRILPLGDFGIDSTKLTPPRSFLKGATRSGTGEHTVIMLETHHQQSSIWDKLITIIIKDERIYISINFINEYQYFKHVNLNLPATKLQTSSSVKVLLGFRTTNALGSSPAISSGMPITATS